MPLVEVAPGPDTDADALGDLTAWLLGAGKRPVVLTRAIPGLVANRLQAALLREAVAIVDAGVIDVAGLDEIVRSSIGPRLAVAGPFEVCDLGGNDVWLALARTLFSEITSTGDVPARLVALDDDGHLGVKTLRGHYPWTPATATDLRARIARSLVR